MIMQEIEIEKIKKILAVVFLVLIMPSTLAITGSIDNSEIIIRAYIAESVEDNFKVINVNDIPINVKLSSSGVLKDYIDIQEKEFTLNPGEEKVVSFTIEIMEFGKTENQINVQFVSEEESAGLNYTVITITPIQIGIMYPPNYIYPLGNFSITGDFTVLYVVTDGGFADRDDFCEYKLDGSQFIEIPREEDKLYGLITNLNDTTSRGPYNLEVRCNDRDDEENFNIVNMSLEVNLSIIERFFIRKDIEDYKYYRSMGFEEYEREDINSMNFAYYEKDNEEDYLYSVDVFEMKNESFLLTESFLEEINGEMVSIQTINNQNVYVYDDGYERYLYWYYENLMIYIMKLPNVEGIGGMDLIGHVYGPLYMEEMPIDLVKTYLEKYPSNIQSTNIVSSSIELMNPLNKNIIRTNKSLNVVNFNYKIKSKSSIEKCSIIMDEEIKEVQTNVQENIENVFSIELDKGNYDWQIQCIDYLANKINSEIRTLIIKETSFFDSVSSLKNDSYIGNKTYTNQTKIELGTNENKKQKMNKVVALIVAIIFSILILFSLIKYYFNKLKRKKK